MDNLLRAAVTELIESGSFVIETRNALVALQLEELGWKVEWMGLHFACTKEVS